MQIKEFLRTEYPNIPFSTSQPQQTILPKGTFFSKPTVTEVSPPPTIEFTTPHDPHRVECQH